MGLDIDCECEEVCFRASSYSGFHLFRVELAKVSGTNLEEMDGFKENDKKEQVEGKEWTEKEPFYELLDHSDCDGVLTPKQCANLTKDFKHWKKSFIHHCKLNDGFQWMVEKFLLWEKAVNHSEEKCCTIQFG